MFGNQMRIELDGFGVTLRPHKKEEAMNIAEYYSSMLVQKYTNMTAAVTPKDEEEWWERTRVEKDSRLWAIVPDGSDVPVGSTALHDIHPLWSSCVSGIIIADQKYWGKGIAYRAHLARTWYAVNKLNRYTIQSSVRTPNVASLKALIKVGYRLSGEHDCNVCINREWLNTYMLSWVNPYVTSVLYPQGIPDNLNESLKKARSALELAEKTITIS